MKRSSFPPGTSGCGGAPCEGTSHSRKGYSIHTSDFQLLNLFEETLCHIVRLISSYLAQTASSSPFAHNRISLSSFTIQYLLARSTSRISTDSIKLFLLQSVPAALSCSAFLRYLFPSWVPIVSTTLRQLLRNMIYPSRYATHGLLAIWISIRIRDISEKAHFLLTACLS